MFTGKQILFFHPHPSIVKRIQICLSNSFIFTACIELESKSKELLLQEKKIPKKLSRKETFIWLNVIFSYETPLSINFRWLLSAYYADYILL